MEGFISNMKVKIKLNGGIMPKKQHENDAAFDLYVPENIELSEGRQVIDLMFSMELPHGYAATIQPRSGFSAKGFEVDVIYYDRYGTTCHDYKRIDGDVIRGLVDENYRGNVGVILNVVEKKKDISTRWSLSKGTRIAQMQIVKVPEVVLVEVEELSESERADGGFGSTGTK